MGERSSFSIEAMFRKLEGQDVPLWLEGTVAAQSFRLHKLVGVGSNSSVPILIGTVRPSGQGSVISVLARPSWYPFLFLFAWLAIVGTIAAHTYGTPDFWFPCLLALAGPALAIATFVPQLVSVRRALIQYLNVALPESSAT
jgi:hypothetical protein